MKSQTVKILRYNSEGAGIGALESGKTVFVPFAVSGETVEISVSGEQKNFAFGKLEKVIEASTNRVTPVCPVYGRCGGCALMHISYEKQLEIKKEIVQGSLKRIAGIDFEPADTVPSPDSFGYRNKTSLSVSAAGGGPSIGFYETGSHNVAGIDSCPICGGWLSPVIDIFKKYIAGYKVPVYDSATGKGLIRHIVARRFLGTVQICAVINGAALPETKALIAMLQEKCSSFSLSLSVNTAKTEIILGDKIIKLSGGGKQAGSIAGIKYSAGIDSFLQVNTKVAESLYLKALELSEADENDTVIDAYSGIGILTALFARKARKVYGIETVPAAVADANALMRENGIGNAQNILGDCGKILPRLVEEIGRDFIAVLDPPRKGCDKAVVDALIQNPARKIIYISCDPATLSRDLKLLTAPGTYRLTYCQPFDMFPQTPNIETLSCLTRI